MSIYIQGYAGEFQGSEWYSVDIDTGTEFTSALMSSHDLEAVQDCVSNYAQYL